MGNHKVIKWIVISYPGFVGADAALSFHGKVVESSCYESEAIRLASNSAKANPGMHYLVCPMIKDISYIEPINPSGFQTIEYTI